jgi:hypothetical protein
MKEGRIDPSGNQTDRKPERKVDQRDSTAPESRW